MEEAQIQEKVEGSTETKKPVELLYLPKKKGRTKGVKGDYTLSPAAYHQRTVAALKHGENSEILQRVVNKLGLPQEDIDALARERLQTWKKLSTPALFIADQFVELKSLVDAKLLAGMDPSSGEYVSMMKLFLDFVKEYNRLTQVSADKKLEAFSKSFSESDEIVIDMNEEDKK